MIGKGAMASVYLCQNSRKEWVALKILESQHPPIVRRFNREIAILRSLSHERIVHYIDHGEHEGYLFLVMEYIDGIDLKVYTQKLHQRPPQERYARCRDFGVQLMLALTYVHNKGIIHRDIKPSNILVREEDIVLIDFGTVKENHFSSEKTQLGQLIGTPSYAAPEQIYGGKTTHLSDQFSTGATLYYMITKQRPFNSIDRNNKVRPPSQFDPNIPPQLEATILRMMAFETTTRFSSNEEIIQALSMQQISGIPLAGRQEVLKQIQHILNEAQTQRQLIVRPTGGFGSGKSWASKTLHNGANQRNIPVFEVINEVTAQTAIERLKSPASLLIIDRYGMNIPAEVLSIELQVSFLRLADIRRSIYAHAPKTSNLAKQSERLHRLSGGIPALLIPILKKYTNEQAFLLPERIEAPIVIHDFFHSLDLDALELLGSIALIKRPCIPKEIEQVSMIPTDEFLPVLKHRGLITEVRPDTWMLSAGLFERHIFTLLPDTDGLEQRVQKMRSYINKEDLLEKIQSVELLCIEGKLAQAREKAYENHKICMGYDDPFPMCKALISMGSVSLDLGLFERAKAFFADASALSKAINAPDLKEESHLYRARVSLELRPGSRTAISSAIDRLSLLIINSNNLHTHAMWAWALAALGDSIRWNKTREMILSKISSVPNHKAGRIIFCLLRASCCIGDQEQAKKIITIAEPFITSSVLFSWEFGRAEALLTKKDPPPTSPLAYGLTPVELQALKNRWIYAKGISPDPTWTN
jgi:serine/threonine protein kinase